MFNCDIGLLCIQPLQEAWGWLAQQSLEATQALPYMPHRPILSPARGEGFGVPHAYVLLCDDSSDATEREREREKREGGRGRESVCVLGNNVRSDRRFIALYGRKEGDI